MGQCLDSGLVLVQDDGLAGSNLVVHSRALRGFGCTSSATGKKSNVERGSSTSKSDGVIYCIILIRFGRAERHPTCWWPVAFLLGWLVFSFAQPPKVHKITDSTKHPPVSQKRGSCSVSWRRCVENPSGCTHSEGAAFGCASVVLDSVCCPSGSGSACAAPC